MITNVEGIINRRQLRRRQANKPISDVVTGAMYVTLEHPEPGLGDSEPYKSSEITPCDAPDSPEQVIEHETALSTDAVAMEYTQLKQMRKQLLEERTGLLRSKWTSLLASEKVTKTFYAPIDITVVRKPLYRRVKTGTRTVKRRVQLAGRYEMRPVKLTTYATVHGRKVRLVQNMLKRVFVQPTVWRDFEIPTYERRLVRAGGPVRRRVRVPKQVTVRDWASIRAKYSAFKLSLTDRFESSLRSISQRFEELAIRLKQRPPRLMLSYTTHGCCRPYHAYESQEPYSVPVISRRATSLLRSSVEDFSGDTVGGFYAYTPGYGALKDEDFSSLSNAQIEWFHMPHPIPLSGHEIQIARFPRALDQLRIIDRDGEAVRSQAMLAYSTVASLTKARDYQFQWFRSLMELKDTKETLSTARRVAKAGRGFLNWLSTTRQWSAPMRSQWQSLLATLAPKFGTGVRLLAASYLTWKFAIQPTLADVNTVVSQTAEWLFEIRRALRYVLEDLNKQRNTFHARAKYGDSRRDLKLGRYVELDPQHRRIEISVPVTIKWPALVQTVVPGNVGTGTIYTTYQEPPYPRESGVVDWPFPSARLTSQIFTNSELYTFNQTASGGVAHQVFDDTANQPYAGSSIQPPTLDYSVQDVEDFILSKVFSDSTLVERVPVYGQSYTSGVVFAEYRVEDLLELLSHSGSALAGFDSLVARLLTGAEELLTRLDLVKTAWELTPLSFVYDWFTDSSTIVTVLANAARQNWAVYNQVPVPVNGIHETRRNELLLGTPLYRPTGCRVLEYVSSYAVPEFGYLGALSRPYRPIMLPEVSIRNYRLMLECTDDKVHLERSGLYRVRRGEQTGYSSLSDYLPRLSVSINGGKILSLSALIANLLGSR